MRSRGTERLVGDYPGLLERRVMSIGVGLIFLGSVGWFIVSVVVMAELYCCARIGSRKRGWEKCSIREAWGDMKKRSLPSYIAAWMGLPGMLLATFCLWLSSLPSPSAKKEKAQLRHPQHTCPKCGGHRWYLLEPPMGPDFLCAKCNIPMTKAEETQKPSESSSQ